MAYLEVVLNLPLLQNFTYKAPEIPLDSKKYSEPLVGKRCEVPFRNRKMTAYIIAIHQELPSNLSFSEDKIKTAHRILDKDIIFTQEQIQLAFWISKYYLCSPGEALSCMITSGRKEISFSAGFEEEASNFNKKILSQEQEQAISEILQDSSKRTNYHYLYGKTGTGKTEVFLTCAEKILEQEKGVIYLVPEISLTHQVIEAVVARFGSNVAVLHSGLTPSQKLSEWNRILKREARIVIGARSAVFAPVPNLGMIIIDEEHDNSYKSGTTPRYHARQVAMKRCSSLAIPLLMGSATPSVEAWHFIQEQHIKKHTLTKRLAGGKEPELVIEDLSKLILDGAISPRLENEIRQTLLEKRQTILFLNRRGFTHFFVCNTCGYELKCKNCSVSLTLHKKENRLRCHYCGWSIAIPHQCPQCNSLDVQYKGFGTQFIEKEVAAKFPNAKIARIDTDALTEKNMLQDTLQDFKNGKIDILLGTQMVAKGLNFPQLKLVGIIMADTGLHMPDFRASERTFSLITQVAGRAGRFFPDGKVIIQTYSPQRPAIHFASENKVESFYTYELDERKLLDFPPFSRLIRLVFRSASEIVAKESAENAAIILENLHNNQFDILGPTECPLEKIAANYRYQILLKSDILEPMQKAVAVLLYNYKSPSGVYIEVDVDPTSLL